MKLYKKIKGYPGSAKVPEIIKQQDEYYYSEQPNLYPEFWEELKIGKVLLTSKDGVDIETNTQVFLVDDKLNIHPIVIDERYANSDSIFFTDVNKATEYINSLIEISIVNEVIKGENIPLYGCLITNSYQLGDTTSLALWKRMRQTNTKPSDKWKYFRTKDEREEYIHYNSFIYTRNTIKELFDWSEYRKEKSAKSSKAAWNMIIDKLKELL
jgi:hypothetical protein